MEQFGIAVPDESVLDLFAKVGTVSVKVFDINGDVTSFYTELQIEIQDTERKLHLSTIYNDLFYFYTCILYRNTRVSI